MQIPFTTFEAIYRVTRPFRMPYHPGSMIRGTLGRALRMVACSNSPGCALACGAPSTCSWTRLFEPAPRLDLPVLTRSGSAQSPPPPLIPLIPSPGGQALDLDSELSLGLRVVGTLSADDSDRILRALEAFERFPLSDGAGAVRLVRSGFSGRRDQRVKVGDDAVGDGRVRARFETPAWLLRDKQPALDLDFRLLFRSAWRRLAALCALYGQADQEDDGAFGRLDALAADVSVTSRRLKLLRWERRSDETGRRHGMMGLVGEVEFAGPVGAFQSTLRAMEQLHVGKSTSFGLGRVRVSGESR